MKPVRFYAEAEDELRCAAVFYERQQAGLGKRFLDAAFAAVYRMRLFPGASPSSVEGCRQVRVERFPLGIVFRERPDEIAVVAVIHFKRRPGYWRTRTGTGNR
jgi:plasmid stabilization system protein ParE